MTAARTAVQPTAHALRGSAPLAAHGPRATLSVVLRWRLRDLLPGSCLLCEGPLGPDADVDLCRHCLATLPWNDRACPRCAEPAETVGVPAGTCRRCLRRAPPFALVLAPLCYEGPVRRWMLRLKDRLGMVEGRLLGTLLANAAAERYGHAGPAASRRPDLLVPVPLTARRLARRGHNQALTLARPVARRLGIPVARHVVTRQAQGHRQRGLSREQRLELPSDVFRSRRRWSGGPCIGIVDDVVTTGATAAELTRVLLDAGAAEVHVLCAARTRRQLPTRGTDSASPGTGA